MVEQKVFNGIMNLDDANDVMPSRHHKYAMNIKFRGNAGNIMAENINGNRLITNSLPSGNNQCIGAIFDEVKNRVYYFNYNSLGNNGIYYYNTLLKTITPVLISYINSAEDIFNFNPQYPIPSINLLYKDAADGDVLYWTDRLNRPKFLNVKDALSNSLYSSGTQWLSSYLTVAKIMPLIPPVCSYEDNASLTINNLKNKLYEFRYRWVYNDNSKSTWSPWSKLFAPSNVDSLSIEIDPTKNNTISVILNSGPSDCIKVEIGARQSLATTFSNQISVVTLIKSEIPVLDNVLFTFKFINDSSYEYVDESESLLLYDYVPKKANAQELINGNLLIYGGLTEGNTFDRVLNINKTVSLIDNTPGSLPLNITTIVHGNACVTTTGPTVYYNTFHETFILSGGSLGVASITLNFYYTGGCFGGTDPINDRNSGSVTYTVNPTDTITDMLNGLLALFPIAGSTSGSTFNAAINTTGSTTYNSYSFTGYNAGMVLEPFSIGIIPGYGEFNNVEEYPMDMYGSFSIAYTGGNIPVNDVNISCYKHDSRYTFGMVYFDEFGVTNGVVTNETMKVAMPKIDIVGIGTTTLTIPAVKFSVNHQPPTWAKYFSFVRTNNLTVAAFKTIKTDKTYQDGTYGYLDITLFNTNSDGFETYDFAKGDRIRLVGKIGTTVNTVVGDYPILDVLTDRPTGATLFPLTGFFIKVQYDSTKMSSFGTSGFDNYYIEAYTPALNIDKDLQVFYEFGENYTIYTDINGNLAHSGQSQFQIVNTGSQPTAAKPAIFSFVRGDIYQRKRATFYILDQSVSDKFDSKIIGNGRPFVIDPFAKEIYNPTLVRYGESYQQGTLINAINRFYSLNFEEYDRQKGDIQRLKLKEKVLRIFQSRGTGVVNVYATEMTNQDGSTNLIGSTNILNPINYYAGQYGIGNQYCSLTSSSSADYYVDPINGYHMRLGRDGNTALSELYKGQYFFPSIANKYLDNYTRSEGGYAKILGVYDNFEEEYISIFQTGTKSSVTLTPYTVGFSEKKNAYSSFYGYQPEWMECANNILISWKNGGLYLHDSATQNNFYGVQGASSITLVFNEKNIIKKTFDNITIDANVDWNSATTGNVNTSLGQTSNLVASDYELHEGFRHAALMRDSLSLGGIVNGDYLKGTWLEVKLNNSATNLVYLSGLYMGYQVSPRNF